MQPEVRKFLEGLDATDVKELQDILDGRRSRKWITVNLNYLIRGLVFLISSWIVFETFIKQLLTKIFH